MIIVDGVEYATKEEAAQLCRLYVDIEHETVFHNYAHCKEVRRRKTSAELAADRARGCSTLEVTLYEWNKLYTDAPILKAHPELRGMWRQRQIRSHDYPEVMALNGGQR